MELPLTVMLEVFSWLDHEDVIRSSTVSRWWALVFKEFSSVVFSTVKGNRGWLRRARRRRVDFAVVRMKWILSFREARASESDYRRMIRWLTVIPKTIQMADPDIFAEVVLEWTIDETVIWRRTHPASRFLKTRTCDRQPYNRNWIAEATTMFRDHVRAAIDSESLEEIDCWIHFPHQGLVSLRPDSICRRPPTSTRPPQRSSIEG